MLLLIRLPCTNVGFSFSNRAADNSGDKSHDKSAQKTEQECKNVAAAK